VPVPAWPSLWLEVVAEHRERPNCRGLEVDLHDFRGRCPAHHHMKEHAVLRKDGQSGGVVEERDIDVPLVHGVGVHDFVGAGGDQGVDPGGEPLEDEPVLYLTPRADPAPTRRSTWRSPTPTGRSSGPAAAESSR
jgi:hypothetical protein